MWKKQWHVSYAPTESEKVQLKAQKQMYWSCKYCIECFTKLKTIQNTPASVSIMKVTVRKIHGGYNRLSTSVLIMSDKM